MHLLQGAGYLRRRRGHDLLDLDEREAKTLQSLDSLDALELVDSVVAELAVAAPDRLDQPQLFVVSERSQVGLGLLGELSDLHEVVCHCALLDWPFHSPQ